MASAKVRFEQVRARLLRKLFLKARTMEHSKPLYRVQREATEDAAWWQLVNIFRRLFGLQARGAELPCEEASPSWTAHSARLLVNRSSPRRMVKPAMVNRSGPDLFPAACILKKPFIPPKMGGVAPLA